MTHGRCAEACDVSGLAEDLRRGEHGDAGTGEQCRSERFHQSEFALEVIHAHGELTHRVGDLQRQSSDEPVHAGEPGDGLIELVVAVQ
jgi:hypothetical protein